MKTLSQPTDLDLIERADVAEFPHGSLRKPGGKLMHIRERLPVDLLLFPAALL
jgi:hypothetical protein